MEYFIGYICFKRRITIFTNQERREEMNWFLKFWTLFHFWKQFLQSF